MNMPTNQHLIQR